MAFILLYTKNKIKIKSKRENFFKTRCAFSDLAKIGFKLEAKELVS